MLTVVGAARSSVDSFGKAIEAFRCADSRVCLDELRRIDSDRARLLESRVYLRLGQYARALDVIPQSSNTDSSRAEAAMLRAAVCVRLGESAAAELHFADARTFSISAGETVLEAEVSYHRAVYALADADAAAAAIIAKRALSGLMHAADRGSDESPRHHLMGRLFELLAVVAARDGRYPSAIDLVRQGRRHLAQGPERDLYLEAFALKNLAIFSQDFDLPDSAAVCDEVMLTTWTPDLALVKFMALEAAGWCAALRGDAASALRRYRAAEKVAFSEAEQAMISLDRAILARESGYAAMADDEIENAFDLAARFDWESTPADTRNVLLQLAQVGAAHAPAKARATLERYRSITRPVDSRYASRSEDRVRAEEAFAHGLVLRAEGRTNASMEQLATAFKLWSAIGYEWRAGRAAVELAELDAGDVFRLAVRRELRARPDSVFAARARLVA